MLVCMGYCNKNSMDRHLKQQTFISHSSGGWEVQNRGAGMFSVWWGSTFWFILGCFPVCSHVVEGARKLSEVSFLRTHSWEHLPCDLSTSRRPYPLIPSCWGLGFNIRILRGHTHSVYSISMVYFDIIILLELCVKGFKTQSSSDILK